MILAIYGAGGLGREIAVLAEQINAAKLRWNEIVFVDDFSACKTVREKCVLKFDDIEKVYEKSQVEFVVGVGEPSSREALIEHIASKGYHFATLVHPNVYIDKTTTVGVGSVIGFNCHVSCNVTIGNNVLVQPMASIGHDTQVGNNSIVSAFTCLAGHVAVGHSTYISMNVPVKEGTTIGNWTIVGMGSVVVRDLPDEVIVLGNPARTIQRNESHKVFKG